MKIKTIKENNTVSIFFIFTKKPSFNNIKKIIHTHTHYSQYFLAGKSFLIINNSYYTLISKKIFNKIIINKNFINLIIERINTLSNQYNLDVQSFIIKYEFYQPIHSPRI